MKNIVVLSLLFAAVACFGGNPHEQHARQKQTEKQTPSNSVRSTHVMISLPTMQCSTCAETIQKAVEKVEGVQSVSVVLKDKMAHVEFDPAKTNQEKIEKAIAAAGYDANETKRDEKAHAKLPKCCQSPR